MQHATLNILLVAENEIVALTRGVFRIKQFLSIVHKTDSHTDGLSQVYRARVYIKLQQKSLWNTLKSEMTSRPLKNWNPSSGRRQLRFRWVGTSRKLGDRQKGAQNRIRTAGGHRERAPYDLLWELNCELVNVDPGDRRDLIYRTTLELREIIYSRSGWVSTAPTPALCRLQQYEA